MRNASGEVRLIYLACADGQDFARKIIRPFGQVNQQDIENEARAIETLLRCGRHPNIITILRHGWLEPPYDYYFIDMEFCDINLHRYIHDEKPVALDTLST